jgi:hypothetical protein
MEKMIVELNPRARQFLLKKNEGAVTLDLILGGS